MASLQETLDCMYIPIKKYNFYILYANSLMFYERKYYIGRFSEMINYLFRLFLITNKFS